ncbi:MAG: short chain dehydrogenase [Microbacterium sp.]
MSTYVITGAGSGSAASSPSGCTRGDALIVLARSACRAAELIAAFPGSAAVVADLADPSALAARSMRPTFLPRSTASCTPPASSSSARSPICRGMPGRASSPSTSSLRQSSPVCAGAPRVRGARTRAVRQLGAGLNAHPGWAAYAASKHGLKASLMRSAAKRAARGAGTVYPGRTATPMQEKVHEQEAAYDADRWIDPASVATAIMTALDLPRDADQRPERAASARGDGGRLRGVVNPSAPPPSPALDALLDDARRRLAGAPVSGWAIGRRRASCSGLGARRGSRRWARRGTSGCS